MIAIGQRAAGDDGVGPAVLDALRAQGAGEGVDLCEVDEPSALLPLLEGAHRVILVDAALGGGGGAGTVHVLAEETLDARDIAPISTHGLTVGQVLGLARALAPDKVCRDISIVAISVERPACLAYGLSPEALAAVPRATEAVRNLVAGAS
ncbi:hydrogenase maturation protease [Polyangium mundeleinium]|uniref:Hydrogenase maturation protease n=1 Tax=Polyangium mundeleinium TaxID=2995306 RepID=A0ABT5ELZ8_9BACT|nr:hydrogenase maturation protease [Polyangium mundeleinium]MDC0742849.1 hydrogenase maturation protease [Polyangium mundeleinium]